MLSPSGIANSQDIGPSGNPAANAMEASNSTPDKVTNAANATVNDTATDTATDTIQPREQTYVPDLDLSSLSLDELSNSEIVYNREMSWLDFNWRVLNEALDARNPLLERLKFIAITASNLDEFFRKRVGGLKRQKAAGIAHLTIPGLTPDHQLQLISKAVRPMIEAQSACLIQDILPALAENGLRILQYSELDF